ncbi:MAG: sulfite exporter TauE/SafE family protein [Bdellovibrionaceae bacterium]|nr:sulfite exporter TauE/SafE family protein [Pseudobdellovibrionaceae bacterium]
MNESFALAFAILSSSFFGSWHCAVMCGPMASLAATRRNLVKYHCGRLVSYVLLGAIAGEAGNFLLQSSFLWIRAGAMIFMASTLTLMGLRLLMPSYKVAIPGSGIMHGFVFKFLVRRDRNSKSFGFLMGLATALLPCGWLYTYVLAAAASRSAIAGAVTLALFWLGGLPALSAAPALFRKGLDAIHVRHQKVAGIILIVASLYAIISFFLFH